VSDEFPIEWDDPAHAEIAWEFDPVHTPNATHPLDFDLAIGPFVGGFGWMTQDPIHVNFYMYYPHVPRTDPSGGNEGPPPDATDNIRAGAKRWLDKILPEVQEKIEHYQRTDFDAMTDAELADEVEWLPDVRRRTGRLHTQVTTPAWIGANLLTDTYKKLAGRSGTSAELEALRLAQGYGNKSIEAGEGLYRLSELAKSIPAVRAALDVDELDASVLDDLASIPDAKPFLDAFAAYLDEFGWRSGGAFSEPTWAESPSTALALVGLYLRTEGYDPAAEQRRLAEERDAWTEEVLAKLDVDERALLEDVIDAARSVARLMEDHNYWMDQRLYTTPRRLVLAAARRLVAKGELANDTDVFYLRGQELVALLRGETSGLRETAQERHADFNRWRDVTPPAYIGAPLPPEEHGRISDEFAPAGRGDLPPGVLAGNGASAGVARGPVRIVPTLDGAGRLRPGDVLVTVATLPPWTPLFAVASAVVTETGGILSHTAITAREYKLPAVLAVPNATRALKDGQLVEVDGTAGTVTVVG